MIKIEVKSGVATSKEGTSRKGTPYKIIEQEAWAFTADRAGNPAPYPSRIVINLENGQPPYPAGFYTLADQSFYVGDFSRLSIGRLALVPIPASAAKA